MLYLIAIACLFLCSCTLNIQGYYPTGNGIYVPYDAHVGYQKIYNQVLKDLKQQKWSLKNRCVEVSQRCRAAVKLKYKDPDLYYLSGHNKSNTKRHRVLMKKDAPHVYYIFDSPYARLLDQDKWIWDKFRNVKESEWTHCEVKSGRLIF